MKTTSLLLRCTALAVTALVLGTAFDSYPLAFFGLTTGCFVSLLLASDYSPRVAATQPRWRSPAPAGPRRRYVMPLAA